MKTYVWQSLHLDPIPGVPTEPMTEEEFLEVEKRYDSQFSEDQAGSLRQHFKVTEEDDDGSAGLSA